jgi:Flp pilus assembly protein TadG
MSARRLRGSRGNVSLLVVIMVPALLMAGGLVLDGGRQLRARRDAGAAAAAAARAATQLSEQELYGNGLDAGLATGRANAELVAQGVTGAVTVDGQTVVVTVTAPVDYLILPGGGSVSTSSSSTPLQGVTAGVGP